MMKEVLQSPFDVDCSTFLLVSNDDWASTQTITVLIDCFRDIEMLKAESATALPCAGDIDASKLMIILDLISIDNADLTISHLSHEFPSARVAAIFAGDREESYQEAVLLKARYGLPHGFIPASVSPDTYAAVLHLIADGGEIMPWTRTEAPSIQLRGNRGIGASGAGDGAPSQYTYRAAADYSSASIDAGSNPLTQREQEVLRLLMTGMQNKVIANRMGISENTIRIHIHHILRKLGVRNRTEAANAGLRSGLLAILILQCKLFLARLVDTLQPVIEMTT